MNELAEAMEKFDREIICRRENGERIEDIADDLGVDEDYVENVVEAEGNYV
jgi:hypothetical protein